MICNFFLSSESEGHYGKIDKIKSGEHSNFDKQAIENPANVKKKIPYSKLNAISKMSPLKAFTELNNLKEEYLETLKSSYLNKNFLVVACTAILHTCESPFEEHKYVIMREIKEITTFWIQLSKYVSVVTNNVAGPEFHQSLVSIAKVLSRFSNIKIEVRESLKLIGSTEMKRKGADIKFWTGFLEFLNQPTSDVPITMNTENIFPTAKDLLEEPKADISPNIVKGAFPSAAEYLRLHMSLLKEDFMGSIRQSIAIYNVHYPEMLHEGLVDSIYVIPRVQLGYGYSLAVREFVDLKFSENPSRKKAILRNDKRLLPGTLLIFTSDIRYLNDLILATVLPSHDEALKELGIVS